MRGSIHEPRLRVYWIMTFKDFFKWMTFIEFDRFLKTFAEFVKVLMTFIDID